MYEIQVNGMAETEKEKEEIFALGHLVAGIFNLMWQYLIILYTGQLRTGDGTFLWICRAV